MHLLQLRPYATHPHTRMTIKYTRNNFVLRGGAVKQSGIRHRASFSCPPWVSAKFPQESPVEPLMIVASGLCVLFLYFHTGKYGKQLKTTYVNDWLLLSGNLRLEKSNVKVKITVVMA